MKLFLASNSPRRKEILKSLNLEFSVSVSDFDESSIIEENPIKRCVLIAKGKAEAVSLKLKNNGTDAFIIAADTLIYKNNGSCGKTVFGKPKSLIEAEAMLTSYSGKFHNVITAVYCIDSLCGKEYKRVNISKVFFKKLEPEEITSYLKTNEWRDAAGGYKIQGAASLFIKKIEGSYSGVMGLPICDLYEIFKKAGISVL
ncbi:Maf family protein [Treponema pedis]|uniref:dTTP/UTP pyrophosphatase n=1 Tax=Treponema pedis str. T A4 TaxID=1291379 RepID=S6A4Q9_9SPIR|nr:Maf family protein [Treponema pedis]AGT44676.1 maf protein [Treponema pedis str. T A4]